MPLRVSNTVEKNVKLLSIDPIPCAANKSVTVLKAVGEYNVEFAGRYIQNVGASDAYYTFGHDCLANNFSGILAASTGNADANGFKSGQQLDVSNCGQHVSVWSIGGTTIAVTLLLRNDNTEGSGNILYPNIGIPLLAPTIASDAGLGTLSWIQFVPAPPFWVIQQTVDAGVTWTDVATQVGGINSSVGNSGKTLRVVARNGSGGNISGFSNSVTVA